MPPARQRAQREPHLVVRKARNVERDRDTDRRLQHVGWTVIASGSTKMSLPARPGRLCGAYPASGRRVAGFQQRGFCVSVASNEHASGARRPHENLRSGTEARLCKDADRQGEDAVDVDAHLHRGRDWHAFVLQGVRRLSRSRVPLLVGLAGVPSSWCSGVDSQASQPAETLLQNAGSAQQLCAERDSQALCC
jgi:hypothetical protein